MYYVYIKFRFKIKFKRNERKRDEKSIEYIIGSDKVYITNKKKKRTPKETISEEKYSRVRNATTSSLIKQQTATWIFIQLFR
jgi:hypothetical protein